MKILIAGVALWSIVHFVPFFSGLRSGLIARLSEGVYKGLFALVTIASIILMVNGWKSTVVETVYVPEPALQLPALVLLFVAMFLMVTARSNSFVKQFIRHPQLTGLALWAAAHLLLNGDNRSLVLFAGMLFWSMLEIGLINHRDGAWVKPEPAALRDDVRNALIAIVVFVVLILSHEYLSGVKLADWLS